MEDVLDIKILAGLEPISSFSPERLRELMDYCQSEKVAVGTDPFKLHGLEGQSVYLVRGEVELLYKDGNKVLVSADSEWAKHPLGKRQPDILAATVIAESQLLRIDDDLLDRMMTWDQFPQNDLTGQTQIVPVAEKSADISGSIKRLLTSNMFSAEKLKAGPLAHLPMVNIGILLQRIEAIAVWEGDVIVREGDVADYYYLIDTGKARVTRLVGGVAMPLAELKAGNVFGEEALVSDAKRNATVTMQSNGVLLRLGRKDFLELLREPFLHKCSFNEAKQKVAAGAIWLDVRYPPEYRHDRLPGALNIPLNDIRNAIGVLDRANQYVAYCQSGRRSAAAAFILAQAGYDVHVLDNGLWSMPQSEPH
jgi:rhodanese-related sulfurtransferase